MAKKPKDAEPVPTGRVRIKMLTTIAGPDISGPAGSILTVSMDQADALIEGGFAEEVGAAPGDPEAGSGGPGQE